MLIMLGVFNVVFLTPEKSEQTLAAFCYNVMAKYCLSCHLLYSWTCACYVYIQYKSFSSSELITLSCLKVNLRFKLISLLKIYPVLEIALIFKGINVPHVIKF